MNSSVSRPAQSPVGALRVGREMMVPVLLFAACLAAQLYLLCFKSFNWDEFLHYAFLYQLKAGTLHAPFQVLHLRALWWTTEISSDLVEQMLAARLFMWVMHLVTLLAIYGVARQFTIAWNAFFAAFAYLTAGYVFLHGFSIRSDPMAAATLMTALFLLARGPLSFLKAIAIGVLIGLAGMMTLKSVFYAPCFACLAWLKGREAPARLGYLAKLAVIAGGALLTFAAVYFFFKSGLPAGPKPGQNAAGLSYFLRWVSQGVPYARYIAYAIILAPLFFLALLFAPFAWKKAGLKFDAKVALAGFVLPLGVLFFYRNTFPYFFVFILAPVAVAIAPSLGPIRDRYGNVFVAILLSAMPLALTVLEPRDVMVRQKALIDYVHREFPGKPGYLDYSGMIADYPRILRRLTSGNGIRLYHEQGDPIVGREIDRGNVPFIIANQEVISEALVDRPFPNSFLPADLAAMRGNYVRQWGVLWREGKSIPAGSDEFEFHLRRGGTFVLDGAGLTIDGAPVAHGASIELATGRHRVGGKRSASSILWRGGKLPTPPPNLALDSVFTNF